LVELAMDENKVVYVVGSPKENSHIGEYSKKGLCWPIQIPSMSLTKGDHATFTKPLPFHLYLVGLGGLSL